MGNDWLVLVGMALGFLFARWSMKEEKGVSASTYYYLEECLIEAISDKAVLVVCDDFDKPEWVPKSHIEEPDKFKVGDENITVGVTHWWAGKMGLEDAE